MAHIGRNEPCWCGSGLKYKKCHLNREDQQAVNPWEAEKALKTSFSTKDCLVPSEYKPQCSGGIVQAHSVARCWLKSIAQNSHVYGFKPSVQALHKNLGKVKPDLIGINNASTFTGFCSSHDKAIFFKIEDHPFIGTAEQCFLLAYRAISREYFTQNGGAIIFSWLKNSAASCHRFIKSIKTMKQVGIPNSIIRFLFEFCENNYVSPVWWDNLISVEKERVLGRFNKAMNPLAKRDRDCLCDDGLSAVSWNISNISSNVTFS